MGNGDQSYQQMMIQQLMQGGSMPPGMTGQAPQSPYGQSMVTGNGMAMLPGSGGAPMGGQGMLGAPVPTQGQLYPNQQPGY